MADTSNSPQTTVAPGNVPAHLKMKCHRCGNTMAYGVLGPGSAVEIVCRHCRTEDGKRTKTMFETPA